MLSLEQAIRTTLAGYERFGALVEDLVDEDLDLPTRLEGWSVQDLVAHVARGQAMEADAARRAVAGDTSLAGADEVPSTASFGALNGALKKGHKDLSSALPDVAELDPATQVTIPAGALPLPGALTLFAVEAGLHASDLAHALDQPHQLREDEVAACVALLRPLLGLSAGHGATASAGTSIELDGETFTERWAAHGSAWAPGEALGDGSATVTVSGSDEALMLFVYGRIEHTDSRLTLSGAPDTAARFKEFFPGP